ncbi:hypothetical protein RJ640_003206 [Escallonia rubra]|uniref:Late embryogenesis abundant protein LEA-2 subgroup domain-containing protein n=1 Tax=Escallonia rubra TaxID=112253 RepID=A0AA88UHC7_9ASTE|nr:hypothetical protein RJ640_003206 [Escallonia rubra]
MASVTDDERDKPVTGYPSQNPRVVTGYPHAATASAPPPSFVYTTAAPYYYFQPQPQPLPQPLPHPHPHHYQHHNHYRQDDDDNDNHRDRPQNHRAHRDQSTRFLCRLLAALLIVFLAMGVVSFAAWLVLRPHLPEFRLASVTASPFNATASSLSATWGISFLVTNPNHKLGIYYDRLDASVFYSDDYLLSRTSLPPFFQLNDNQTLINAKLGVVESNMENDVVKGISSDRAGGRVKFSFRAMAVIRYRSGEWRTTKHLIRVYCEGVEIGFTSSKGPGTMLSPYKECQVAMVMVTGMVPGKHVQHVRTSVETIRPSHQLIEREREQGGGQIETYLESELPPFSNLCKYSVVSFRNPNENVEQPHAQGFPKAYCDLLALYLTVWLFDFLSEECGREVRSEKHGLEELREALGRYFFRSHWIMWARRAKKMERHTKKCIQTSVVSDSLLIGKKVNRQKDHNLLNQNHNYFSAVSLDVRYSSAITH